MSICVPLPGVGSASSSHNPYGIFVPRPWVLLQGIKRNAISDPGVRAHKKAKTATNKKRSRVQANFFADQEALKSIARMRLCRVTAARPNSLDIATQNNDVLCLCDGFPSDHG